MPLNMFGIQYSGLSRMHRCGDIFMPQFLSRQKELLCKQSRKLRGCKSYLRLHSKDDRFILAAKKLWVRLALCTMFMVTSAEECTAANLRIDGPQ